MSDEQLTADQRRQLERQLEQTHDSRVHRRTLAVLKVEQGHPVQEVADYLHVQRSSVYRWLGRYQQDHDPTALIDNARPGRGRVLTKAALDRLDDLLDRSPQDLGHPASQWTVPLLREQLASEGLPVCSTGTLRRRLHDLNRVWKRPRYTLAPDAEKEKKTRHSPPAWMRKSPRRRTVRG